MDSLEKRGLDEDNFGAKGSVVSAFDAFRMFSVAQMTRQAIVY